MPTKIDYIKKKKKKKKKKKVKRHSNPPLH